MALYWTGPGVFSHGGKDYEHGAELPKLDKDTAARLVKKGLAADRAPAVGRPTSEVSQLRDQVKELSEKLKAAGDPEELEKLRQDVETLTAERDELRGTVAELTEELQKSAAGPKEPKK